MRIGFLSDSFIDPSRVRSWSGLPYTFAENFREAGCEVVPIHGQDQQGILSEKLKQAWWKFGRGRRYLRGLNPELLKIYGRSVSKPLREAGIEVVFSATTWLVSGIETDLPVVFWTDATFASMLGYYHDFTKLAPPSLRAGDIVERAALQRADLAVYSTEWAAQSAISDHGALPSKVRVLPFGATLDQPMSHATEEKMIADRFAPGRERCELLFVGVDWVRKGAAIAVEAAADLTRRGIPARLRIVGCQPPRDYVLPDNVEILGFLDKSNPVERARLLELYRDSHFFILPTRAEAAAVVLSEASAYGLPSLCPNVGGLPTSIQNDINGRLFPLSDGGDKYAGWIAEVWADQPRYRQLARDCFREAHERLDGRKSARVLSEWMAGLLPKAERRVA